MRARVPSRVSERLAALGFIGSVSFAVLKEWDYQPSSWFLIASATIGVLAGLRALWKRRPRPREVRVDDTCVHLIDAKGQRRSFPRDALVHAEIAHGEKGRTTLYVLDRGHGVVFALDLETSAEVEEWIRRLGLDRGARELAVHGRVLAVGENETRVLAGTYAALGIATIASLSPMMGAFGSLLPLAALSVWRGRILVGVDGVEERNPRRRRFYPMSEIAEVEKANEKIHLIMKDGRRIRLGVSDRDADAALRDDIAWTIRRALVAYQQTQSDLALEELARRGRDLREWLADLEALDGGDYRRGALSIERLVSTVHDPSADPSARAAAAWILARRGKPEPARDARANAAHPKVRVALDAAMEGDIEALDLATRTRAAEAEA